MHIVCNVPAGAPLSIPINETAQPTQHRQHGATFMNGKPHGKQQQRRSLIGRSVQKTGGESQSGSAQWGFFSSSFLLFYWFSLRLWHILLLPCQCQLVPQVNVEICLGHFQVNKTGPEYPAMNRDKNITKEDNCARQMSKKYSLWSIKIKIKSLFENTEC